MVVNITSQKYSFLINNIGSLLIEGRKKAENQINNILINTYWNIGKTIIEFEQNGKQKAKYGSNLLKSLSNDLQNKYGKGLSQSNVYLMREFYLQYPNFQTVSGKLSWSHYTLLLSIEKKIEKSFYEKQCILERWSFRELRRQVDSNLFNRLITSKNKAEIITLSKKGQIIEKPEDIIKDPYILEFLKIPENTKYTETELEERIINQISYFLKELGQGFTFYARQYRISFEDKHYYVDLVFYNKLMKCYFLIDLKTKSVTPQDVGQMNFYINYFKNEESKEDDNPPIGLILVARKNKTVVRYALGGITNRLFISRYKLITDKLENKLTKYLIKE